jgi:hypothetical protein
MKTDQKLYEELHEKQLTRNDTLNLSWAMQELAKSFSAHNAWDALNQVNTAQRHLNEFRGAIVPSEPLTEQEANLSIGLHTYMRKCMDCPLGTLLYRLISESRGTNIWYAFVKGVNDFQKSPKKHVLRSHCIHEAGINSADACYRVASNTSDDLFMLSALRMWGEDVKEFSRALEWLEGE